MVLTGDLSMEAANVTEFYSRFKDISRSIVVPSLSISLWLFSDPSPPFEAS